MSHPSRGAWIEMLIYQGVFCAIIGSHPSRGAWIEIGTRALAFAILTGRTPRGVRGLKCLHSRVVSGHTDVAPLAGCVD